MNLIKGNISLLMVLFAAALVLAPLVLANLDRVNPRYSVWVSDNNQWYYPTLIGQDINTTLTCIEPDSGFNPLVKSAMTVTFSDKNGTAIYNDNCLDSNTLIEFACGANLNWPAVQTTSSYAYQFNCADINKVCSVGKCV